MRTIYLSEVIIPMITFLIGFLVGHFLGWTKRDKKGVEKNEM